MKLGREGETESLFNSVMRHKFQSWYCNGCCFRLIYGNHQKEKLWKKKKQSRRKKGKAFCCCHSFIYLVFIFLNFDLSTECPALWKSDGLTFFCLLVSFYFLGLAVKYNDLIWLRLDDNKNVGPIHSSKSSFQSLQYIGKLWKSLKKIEWKIA